ncbi:GspH/FimT family pseudopilin [Paraferrimonas sedimenticola]|uniref:Type II secretion system protein H n=1 Tax=Paraferrimonas sedimenticola TaxID=375674 RepID=A0AA37W1R9_9GAMM|nr:GspH/FimT family protein [Paraferrimonas sedimenticola]GLP97138.1 type IV minor pilin protein FimT [Paraferrimonas sedimenticola]
MHNGFTLIEMLVTIIIAAIVLAIGLPAMSQWQYHYCAHSSQLTHHRALNFARLQARLYGATITVCPLVDKRCHSDWNKGYSVFADSQPFGELNDGDEVLQQVKSHHKEDKLDYNRKWIKFDHNGLAYGSNGTLNLCPGGKAEYSRQVVVANTGRSKLAEVAGRSCD